MGEMAKMIVRRDASCGRTEGPVPMLAGQQ